MQDKELIQDEVKEIDLAPTTQIVEMYKKVKAGTSTKEEILVVGKFVTSYLDYVSATGAFYVPQSYVTADNYELGNHYTKYKEQYRRGSMNFRLIEKLNAVGFFWGDKTQWETSGDVITPIRAEILYMLNPAKYQRTIETKETGEQILSDIMARHQADRLDSLEPTKFWINLYHKVKAGTATEQEEKMLGKFTIKYLDYVASTGTFFMTGGVIVDNGYLLGNQCNIYKTRKRNGLVSQKTLNKLDALGFFWGNRQEWEEGNCITPIRAEVLRLLDNTYDNDVSEEVAPTNTACNSAEASITHGQDDEQAQNIMIRYMAARHSTVPQPEYWVNLYLKVKAGTATAREKSFLDGQFVEKYLDYVRETGSFYVSPSTVMADGYKIGKYCNKYKNRRAHNDISHPTINKLDSIGFFWGTKKEWQTQDNMTPVRLQILEMLGMTVNDNATGVELSQECDTTSLVENTNSQSIQGIADAKVAINNAYLAPTRFWINLYKKVKAGTATAEEQSLLGGKFVEHYLDYVKKTGSFYVNRSQIVDNGFLLGSNSDRYKFLRARAELSNSNIAKLDAIGFFWGHKRDWVNGNNDTPIRTEVLGLLRSREDLDDSTLSTSGVENAQEEKIDLTQTRKMLGLYNKIKSGNATKDEELALSRFVCNYLDYVGSTGSFCVLDKNVWVGDYPLGQVSEEYQMKYARGNINNKAYDRLNSVGFYWGRSAEWQAQDNLTPIRAEILHTLNEIKEQQDTISSSVSPRYNG